MRERVARARVKKVALAAFRILVFAFCSSSIFLLSRLFDAKHLVQGNAADPERARNFWVEEYRAGGLTFCEGGKDGEFSRLCSYFNVSRDVWHDFSEDEPVVFSMRSDLSARVNLRSLIDFYKYLGEQIAADLTVVIIFGPSASFQNVAARAAAESPKERFSFSVGTFEWWELFLSGIGYRVQPEAETNRLVAKPLGKVSCGCSCTALLNLTLPQRFDDLIHEFGMILRPEERSSVSLLREGGLLQNMHESCAVVFSSDVLRFVDPPLGQFIDAHDAVFRFNHAPAGGVYERIAGIKTTYRVSFVLETHNMTRNTHVDKIDEAMVLLSIHHKRKAKRILHHDLTRPNGIGIIPTDFRNRSSHCIYGSFHEHPLENGKPSGPHLSSGLIGVFLSLNLCKKTIVFGGMPSDLSDNLQGQLRFHYYENRVPMKRATKTFNSVHGRTQQDEFLAELRSSGTISLVP